MPQHLGQLCSQSDGRLYFRYWCLVLQKSQPLYRKTFFSPRNQINPRITVWQTSQLFVIFLFSKTRSVLPSDITPVQTITDFGNRTPQLSLLLVSNLNSKNFVVSRNGFPYFEAMMVSSLRYCAPILVRRLLYLRRRPARHVDWHSYLFFAFHRFVLRRLKTQHLTAFWVTVFGK